MKVFYATVCGLLACMLVPVAGQAQDAVSNRYSMKLEKTDDGYSLINRDRYAKILDLDAAVDLLVPYVYVPEKVSKEDYSGVGTREFVYRKHDGYELKLIVDMPVTDAPAPFVIYIHGGGWARGNNGANRALSQYMAKQHGVAGVRIAYTLAPQEGAFIDVTISDVLAALDFIKAHAGELNLDPDRYGFVGGSAGAHLSAIGALQSQAKVMVGYSGIYDLQTARISVKATAPERIAYFRGLDPGVLESASPVKWVSNNKPAVLLIAGTGDITVEYQQSEIFAKALRDAGNEKVDLRIFDFYDHNINSNSSDLMEYCLLESAKFILENI